MSIFKNIEPNGQVILTPFDGDFAPPRHITNSADIIQGTVLDLETTGLDRNSHEIVEIALRSFRFDRQSHRMLSVGDVYHGLQEPSEPLSKRTIQLTGLTDADLAGQQINWEEVRYLLDASQVIIAHNAQFDRGFIDLVLGSNKRLWACTLTQIDWFERGCPTGKLELLSHYHGFYVSAHRATSDVNAVLRLLALGEECAETYLSELLSNAKKPFCRIWAKNSPYETKEQLKNRGYKWQPDPTRCWFLDTAPCEVPDEIEWLTTHVYGGFNRAKTERFTPRDRFRPDGHLKEQQPPMETVYVA